MIRKMLPIPRDWDSVTADERDYYIAEHLRTYDAYRAVIGITYLYLEA